MELLHSHLQGGTLYKLRRATTIGDKLRPAGAPVTISELNPSKVGSWITNRVILLASKEDVERWEAERAATEAAEGKAKKADLEVAPGVGGVEGLDPIIGEPDSYIQHISRGWFHVFHHVYGGKVRGQEKAQARLDLLKAGGDVQEGQAGLLAGAAAHAGNGSGVPGEHPEARPLVTEGGEGPGAAGAGSAQRAPADADDFETILTT